MWNEAPPAEPVVGEVQRVASPSTTSTLPPARRSARASARPGSISTAVRRPAGPQHVGGEAGAGPDLDDVVAEVDARQCHREDGLVDQARHSGLAQYSMCAVVHGARVDLVLVLPPAGGGTSSGSVRTVRVLAQVGRRRADPLGDGPQRLEVEAVAARRRLAQELAGVLDRDAAEVAAQALLACAATSPRGAGSRCPT